MNFEYFFFCFVYFVCLANCYLSKWQLIKLNYTTNSIFAWFFFLSFSFGFHVELSTHIYLILSQKLFKVSYIIIQFHATVPIPHSKECHRKMSWLVILKYEAVCRFFYFPFLISSEHDNAASFVTVFSFCFVVISFFCSTEFTKRI